MLTTFRAACELKNKVRTTLFAVVFVVLTASAFAGQEHAAASAAQEHPAAAAGHATDQEHVAGAEHAEHSIGEMIIGLGWPIANFAIFIGVLYYFFNKPLKDYLANRHSTIRKDLVEAAELKATANAQLQQIDQKLQALPGEITALRARGADEIKAEEQRIAAAAAADRERMLEQTRKEIDLQVRLAKKEILEHAADLSVQLATDRIKKEVTPADQDRMVDRYLSQVKEK